MLAQVNEGMRGGEIVTRWRGVEGVPQILEGLWEQTGLLGSREWYLQSAWQSFGVTSAAFRISISRSTSIS